LRYFDAAERFPDRVTFYRALLDERVGPVRRVAVFTCTNPIWLNPRPERVCPEIDLFANPGSLPGGVR